MLHPQHIKKRWFRVHVHAKPEEVRNLVKNLIRNHEIVYCSDRRRRFQTFDICIAPSVFREFQQGLPHTITIAYESKTLDA
jgi:hypothetical protein